VAYRGASLSRARYPEVPGASLPRWASAAQLFHLVPKGDRGHDPVSDHPLLPFGDPATAAAGRGRFVYGGLGES